MKKALVLILAILMIASVFVSCKNTGNNTDTTTTNNSGDTPVVDGFTATEQKTFYVNSAAGLNVRRTPDASVDTNKLGTLEHGKEVVVTGVNEATGWSRILYNGEVAYVKSEFLSSTKPEAVTTGATDTDVPADQFVECNETVYVFPYDDNGKYVSTGSANYYSAPNRAKYAGALDAGVQLTRVAKSTENEDGDGWSKLAYKDANGNDTFIYMRNSVVTTTNPATATDTTTAAQ